MVLPPVPKLVYVPGPTYREYVREMAEQRYYVVGGEYADTSFTVPASGTKLETYGPFSEREAKVCWRELTGKSVDNAMVRYFLKSGDFADKKAYWVVGGEYANSSFTRLASGKELEVYGPFDQGEALGFWRGLTSKSVDDALVRYDIRENYEGGGSQQQAKSAKPAGGALQPTAVKSVTIACAPARVFQFLLDARNWPQWAIHNVKSVAAGTDGVWNMQTTRGPGTLKLEGDAASGVIDHVFTDGAGNAWRVPGRVVPGGGGAVYMLVFTKPPSQTDAQFADGMRQMDDELAALKRILESTGP